MLVENAVVSSSNLTSDPDFTPVCRVMAGIHAESTVLRKPETRALATNMMKEAQDIAEKLGIEFRHTIERRF